MSVRYRLAFFLSSLLCAFSVNARGSEPVKIDPLIQKLKAPAGFELTLFAKPPEIQYPTCLSASAEGEIYVGIDENGSLDAQAKRGRIVRCSDTDHDGKADVFKTFAQVDSPRGLIAAGSKLYVLHPPLLSVFFDEDGDGVSERSETLVKGIGRDLKFRGADHTTNGIRLGIDGYIYIAVGDYGFTKAEGTDGKSLQLHGGGIVRVRTDGRALEIVSRGQRNIYDVAIDPYMNLFTRDNTNDGGGWDVRLTHVLPTANYGYPSLFTHFPEEILPPLADYGGGSPTGSLYVQDSALPKPLDNALLTCEWGREAVYRHPLKAEGGSFKAGQETFLDIPRPTDIDIDGSGNLYVSSWHEGGFVYSGPNVGYIVRLSPSGAKPTPFPKLAEASPEGLVQALGSSRQVLRGEAQRIILLRSKPEIYAAPIEALAKSKTATLEARVAAVFTLGALLGKEAAPALLRLVEIEELRESALRALIDRMVDGLVVPIGLFFDTIHDPNPRVRLVAVVGLGKVGDPENVVVFLSRTTSPDPIIAHLALEALRSLGKRAIPACAEVVREGNRNSVVGTCRVLETIHDPEVVSLLISAVKNSAYRRSILGALCRLAHREADWDGSWWGTRPDTSGPYFQGVEWSETARIVKTLRDEMKNADPETARWLLSEMIRNKVDLEQLIPSALALADRDPGFVESAVTLLDGRSRLGGMAIDFLGKVVENPNDPANVRAKAAAVLMKRLLQHDVQTKLIEALGPIGLLETPSPELMSAWQDFRKDNRNARDFDTFANIAEGPDQGEAILAYAVLLNIESNPRYKADASAAIAKAWLKPEPASRLLLAIGKTGARSYAPMVRSHLKDLDPTIQKAADAAFKGLGLNDAATGPVIAGLPIDEVIEAVQKAKGDPALGAQLFERQNCVACHTVVKGDPVKGPYLGDVAARYGKKELAESILKPSAKIAQGFETQKFAMVSGETVEGFVVRESGNEIEIRNGTGAVTVLAKSEIEERGKSAISMMPNGLADPLTPGELASILSYLESLKP